MKSKVIVKALMIIILIGAMAICRHQQTMMMEEDPITMVHVKFNECSLNKLVVWSCLYTNTQFCRQLISQHNISIHHTDGQLW